MLPPPPGATGRTSPSTRTGGGQGGSNYYALQPAACACRPWRAPRQDDQRGPVSPHLFGDVGTAKVGEPVLAPVHCSAAHPAQHDAKRALAGGSCIPAEVHAEVADGLLHRRKGDTRGSANMRCIPRWRCRTKEQPFGLGPIQPSARGTAVQGDRAIQRDGNARRRARAQGGVVSVLVAGGGRLPPWQEQRLPGPSCLLLPQVCCQRLRADDVQQGAEGAALLHAAKHWERRAEVPVKRHPGLCARKHQLHPRHRAGREAQPLPLFFRTLLFLLSPVSSQPSAPPHRPFLAAYGAASEAAAAMAAQLGVCGALGARSFRHPVHCTSAHFSPPHSCAWAHCA